MAPKIGTLYRSVMMIEYRFADLGIAARSTCFWIGQHIERYIVCDHRSGCITKRRRSCKPGGEDTDIEAAWFIMMKTMCERRAWTNLKQSWN